ncbi:MAG: hypothetical protein ACE37F_13390 [Nannocystaceae bacterium]|nr:hypothetical protein [bacterium]
MTDDDEMPDVPELDAMLSAYRAETARSAADVDAALRAVSGRVGAATGGTAAASGMSTTAKVGLASALLGVAGVLGVAMAEPESAVQASVPVATSPRPPDPPPEPPTQTRPVLEAEPTPPRAQVETAPPSPTATPRKPKRPPRAAPRPAPAPTKPPPTSSLAQELQRLQQARRALRSGDAARARALIEAHRRDYPASSVARERDATEIAALCAEKRSADAKRKAAAFAKAYPGSSQDLLADCDD